MMKDKLGDRMKKQYEDITRHYLPRRTYTIIRLDGKAFHTLTKQLHIKAPFDDDFIDVMDSTALYLVRNIQGVIFGYVQSDEITLVLQDFKTINTCAWLDGNIQKITSISASMATAHFNSKIKEKFPQSPLAFFDSRVFTIADPYEVINCLVWRNKDCIRNSILSVSQNVFGKKAINNKNCKELKEMLIEQSCPWEDFPFSYRYGRMILKADMVANDPKPFVITSAFDFTGKDDGDSELYKWFKNTILNIRED